MRKKVSWNVIVAIMLVLTVGPIYTVLASSLSTPATISPYLGTINENTSMVSSSQPFVRAQVVNNHGKALAAATAQLWRYPEAMGGPQLVAQSTTDSTGSVSLSDQSLSSFHHSSSYVHYAITIVGGGSASQFGNYDWSAYVSGGDIETKTLTVTADAYAGQSSPTTIRQDCAPPGGGAISPLCGGLCQGMPPTWGFLKNLGEQYTVIGEVHASDGMSATFDYGVNSGSTLQIDVATGTGSWQVSGSVSVQNTLSSDTTWPSISAAAYQAESLFSYEEDQYLVCSQGNYVPSSPPQYKVYSYQYDGGTAWGSSLGGDYASPCDVTNNVYGTWASYLPGSSSRITETSGITYSAAVSLSGLIGGATSSITLTDTTSYGTSTSISWSVGTVYSQYYSYYQSSGGYPVVYWTTSGVGCTGTDAAQFISQTPPPSSMCPGQTANVAVTMKNTGTSTWGYDGPNPWRLGAQNPQDNTIWGMLRTYLPQTVTPGGSYTFQWTVTAPNTPGTYNFQWRMVHEWVQWFGDFSPNVQVTVNSCSPLLVDSSAQNFCSHSTTSCVATLTTYHQNDIIIVFASESLDLATSCTFGVTDTAGLTWAARSPVVYGRYDPSYGWRDQLQEWWAKSAGILSSDSITESISGCPSQYGGEYNGLQVFAVSGANFNNPFDPNSSLPGTGSNWSTGSSATVSTTNPNDLVFAAVQAGGVTPVAQSGFTMIIVTGGAGIEYEIASGTLSNSIVTFSFAGSAPWEEIADAITS